MPRSDLFSVLIGISIGILVVALISRIGFRRFFSKLSLPGIKVSVNSQDAERILRTRQLRHLEGLHLAPFFCRLSDIYLPQKLISNPLFLDLNVDLEEIPAVLLHPFSIPQIPEFNLSNPLPLLTLAEALSGGRNILLKGRIGSGKTTALANLALEILEHRCAVTELNDYLPFFIHARDLVGSENENDLENYIVGGLGHRLKYQNKTNIVKILHDYRDTHRLVILIDGLDELSRVRFDEIAAVISIYAKAHPDVKIVTTSGPYFSGGLIKAGFAPLYLKPVEPLDSSTLVDKFLCILPAEHYIVKKGYIKKWMEHEFIGMDLFTVTLEIISNLSSYSKTPRRLLENYTLQASNGEINSDLLSYIAEQFSRNQNFSLTSDQLHDCLQQYKNIEDSSVAGTSTRTLIISSLVGSNIIVQGADGFYFFTNPELMCRLLSQSRTYNHATDIETMFFSPIEYRSLQLSTQIQYIETWQSCEPHDDTITSLITLDHALAKGEAIKDLKLEPENLAKTVISSQAPMSLRYCSAVLLYYTQSSVLNILLERFSRSSDPGLLLLASLFAGKPDINPSQDLFEHLYQNDDKLLRNHFLISLIMHPEFDREGLITAEMSGIAGRNTAELMGLMGEASRKRLLDFAHAENPNCRRNAVYGLRLTAETWAHDTIKHLNNTDKAWMVRDAAAQAMEKPWDTKMFSPQRLPPLNHNPEIVLLADRHKLKIPLEGFNEEFMRKLIDEGDDKTRLLAIQYLFSTPSVKSLQLQKILVEKVHSMQEVALYALQELCWSNGFSDREVF